MPSVNPGPATTNNPNNVLTLTPSNTTTNSNPQESNQIRLLAAFRGISLSGTGDVAAVGIINASVWAPTLTIITNGLVNGVSATIAAASLGIYAFPAAAGQVIRTAGVLTGQTASTVVTTAAAPAGALALAYTSQYVYVNQTVAVAGGTVDLFLYGYDLS